MAFPFAWPFACGACAGLVERDDVRPHSKPSSGMGVRSGWKAGNLKVWLGLGSRLDEDAMAAGKDYRVKGRKREVVD